MRQRIIITSILVLLATVTLLALNLASDKPNKYKNGFTRHFIDEPLQSEWSIDIPYTAKKICGQKGDSVFVSGTIPGLIYIINRKNHSLDSIHIKIEDIPKLMPVFSTKVDYPTVYIFGENAKCVISGDLLTMEYTIYPMRVGAYKNVQMLSPGSIVISAIDTITYNSVIKKVAYKIDYIQDNNNLLPQLADAGFTFDGMIAYDKKTNLLAHVCFYSNNITCFDTLLNKVYRKHTIDTFSTSRLKVKRAGLSITSASPPLMVNSTTAASHGILFVHSKMKSDNQNPADFRNNSTLDIYSLKGGDYIRSLRIPVVNGEKLKRFEVRGDSSLLGIYSGRLVSYSLKENIKTLLQ